MGHFGDRLNEVFPGADPYDCIIPPKTLGSWIKNQRLRRGMEQKQLARQLGVHVFSLIRYERDGFRPEPDVRARLKKLFGPGLDRFFEPATMLTGARRSPAPAGDGYLVLHSAMKPKRKAVPSFKSEEEESKYWDKHSATEHLSQFRIERNVRFRRPARRKVQKQKP